MDRRANVGCLAPYTPKSGVGFLRFDAQARYNLLKLLHENIDYCATICQVAKLIGDNDLDVARDALSLSNGTTVNIVGRGLDRRRRKELQI